MKKFRQTPIGVGGVSEFEENNRRYRKVILWVIFVLLFMVAGIFLGISFLFPETDESDPIPDTRRNAIQIMGLIILGLAIVVGIIAFISQVFF